jgi:hypothetical protein
MSWVTGTATDVADLLDKLDDFLQLGHALEPQYDSGNAGDGTIDDLIGTASSIVETITCTFTNATDFGVVGSVTGSLGTGTSGTPFTSSVANFTINDGGTPWAAADVIIFQMTPPWENKRTVTGSSAEYIWRAPGNDDTNSIYVGVQRFLDVSGDYDNLRLCGMSGFNSGLTFLNQPNALHDGQPFLCLLRTGSMPYWFVASGRRVVIVVKASTVYQSAYMGFIDTYGNPSQFPYPLAIGGSMAWVTEPGVNSINWKWNYTGAENAAFPFGNSTGVGLGNDKRHPMRLRRPDGVWRGYQAATQILQSTQDAGYVWPYCCWAGSPSSCDVRANLDGGYTILPIILAEDAGTPAYSSQIPHIDGRGDAWLTPTTPNVWGELEGVGFVTGSANSAENTVTIDRKTWLVVQNVFRATLGDFFAVKLI